MARWDKISSKGRVEDRRGVRTAAIGGISLTGLLVLMGLSYLMGGNPLDVLTGVQNLPVEQQLSPEDNPYAGEDPYEIFAAAVLGSNNDWWEKEFSQLNREYREPRLVLFRDLTESSCGYASSQVGPHYCPLDLTIYLDETFFDELTNRFGARGGDVAEAYVIAHEVGHHVQNLLGLLEGRSSNEDSVRIELAADCMAGLWAYSIRDEGVFEPGEIEEAMDAAAAVGDDRIQEKVTGQINPESWTHGSSEERRAAFTRGYETGELSSCGI